MAQDYVTVKIPKSLADNIDELRERKPDYRSRAEVVVAALRDFLEPKPCEEG